MHLSLENTRGLFEESTVACTKAKSVSPLCMGYYALPVLSLFSIVAKLRLLSVSINVQGEDDLRHQELLSAIEALGRKR